MFTTKNPSFNETFYTSVIYRKPLGENPEELLSKAKKALLMDIIRAVIAHDLVGIERADIDENTTYVVNAYSKYYGIIPSSQPIVSNQLLAVLFSRKLKESYLAALEKFFTPHEFIKHYLKLAKAETAEISEIDTIIMLRQNYFNEKQTQVTKVSINADTTLVFDSGFYWVMVNNTPRAFTMEDFKDWKMPDTTTIEFGVYLYIVTQQFKLNLEKEPAQQQPLDEFLKTISVPKDVAIWIALIFPNNTLLSQKTDPLSTHRENELIKELSCQGTIMGLIAADKELTPRIPSLINSKQLAPLHFETSSKLGEKQGKNPTWYIFDQLLSDRSRENQKILFTLINQLLENNLLTVQACYANPSEGKSVYTLLNSAIQDEYDSFYGHRENAYTEFVVLIRILHERGYYIEDLLGSITNNIKSVEIIRDQLVMVKKPVFSLFFSPTYYPSVFFKPQNLAQPVLDGTPVAKHGRFDEEQADDGRLMRGLRT